MSDLLKIANQNVERYSKRLNAALEPHLGSDRAAIVVATIEGLILAHIQKTIAHTFGGVK